MCGRLNIEEDPLVKWVNHFFGMTFTPKINADLRPTQEVSTIIYQDDALQQLDTQWGIRPGWSKKPIINAQGETASSKKTFKMAFKNHRCLVPCTGWYEWRDEGGPQKQRYSFTHAEGQPFLMAGIWFQSISLPEKGGPQKATSQLVTLTTHPNERCGEIHKRMPVLIMPEDAGAWFNGTTEAIQPLIDPIDDKLVKIEKH